MGQNGQFVLLCAGAYLAGSIPFGKVVGNLRGIDIQKQGSGNIGFANVRRTSGLKIGLLVLAGDILKGYLPVLAATHLLSTQQTMVVALLAIAGHLFPVWLRFKGGKGVATTIGVSLAISLAAGLTAGAIYIAGTALFRKSAPASLLAVWTLPWAILIFTRHYFWMYVFLALVITWTHRSNIRQAGWLRP